MAAKMNTGQTAEIAGPKKANVVPNPDVAAKLISRAKRPLLVIGSESTAVKTKDGDLVDTAIRVMRNEKRSLAGAI